jgi:FkbM family methyltransferase
MAAPRPLPFVLSATDQGTLIVNHLDYKATENGRIGVGAQLLDNSAYDAEEVDLATRMLTMLHGLRGPAVVAVDCGANLGVHSVSWAKHMTGWGQVLAIEAQEYIYYALAGNIVLQNCFNARALHAAVGREPGTMMMPRPDYTKAATFGSLEIRPRDGSEHIGQDVSYDPRHMVDIDVISIDQLKLPRLDWLKIDVEGMELDVLEGAKETIARCRPLMLIEYIKSSTEDLHNTLSGMGYHYLTMYLNVLAIPSEDPMAEHIKVER